MAITSGVGPHRAWLNVNGTQFPILSGNVVQTAKRKSSQFHVSIPFLDGAYDMLNTIGKNEATISTMTRGVTGQLLTGVVRYVYCDLIGGTIKVEGADKSSELHNRKSSEKWQNKKPSEIVSDLIGRVGLSGNVTPSELLAGKRTEQDYVKLSDNVSYSYIIHKLSEFDGARWFVDNNGQFQYLPLNSPTGIYKISIDRSKRPISSDCLSLHVKRNVEAGKDTEVTVKSWNPRQKRVNSYTSVIPGNGGPLQFNYHIPNLQQDHVQKYAQSLANAKARHELAVSATVVGDPNVNASMGLSLSGTKYFDQVFDIDTVRHDIGMRGHHTHITARSAKEGRVAS